MPCNNILYLKNCDEAFVKSLKYAEMWKLNEKGEFMIPFQTDKIPPIEYVKKLSLKHPHLRIRYNYLFCDEKEATLGKLLFQNGKKVDNVHWQSSEKDEANEKGTKYAEMMIRIFYPEFYVKYFG